MTCIVAVAKRGKVYMGTDAIASNGSNRSRCRSPKMARVGEMLVGWCGSFRMAQILQHEVSAPKLLPAEDAYAWLVKEFVPEARNKFKSLGFATTKDGADVGGNFLVGMRGRVYQVQSDFSVLDFIPDDMAIGAGEDFALGSLYTTRDNPDPEARVRLALEAAADLSALVCPPFFFDQIGTEVAEEVSAA